ncbi:MAG TPA: glutamate-1-semialdehyde 2,1-aminomutase [Gemmatimonadaceae bacterium]|nr:glutamate-1-semialdehyde 2,1-aminomutase [Gemmatimonadaceae bacterium]
MRSFEIMSLARSLFPGGVNSPVRAFRGVGGEPVVVERGEGARIRDVDGKEYLDFVLSWGPLVLGHASPIVLQALTEAMEKGTSFGMPTELEVKLGELVRQRMSQIEMMRFVSSGTEATMSAIRLARAFTGRDAILKFEGCYHGHADSFLVRAGSGVATLGLPDSPGVPAELATLTLTAPYNDLDAARDLIHQNKGEVAAIIVEPVVGNSGFIPPITGFLEGLRSLADESGALLIFDEVMTGFRIAPGGARGRYGVNADLTTLGKVIGGGLPVALYGGRREIMERIAPAGPVYQAGTLSGNPLAMAAGIATLNALTPALHSRIEKRTTTLVEGLQTIADELGVSMVTGCAGSMWGFFFSSKDVRNFTDAKESDVNMFRRFFHAALARGIYLAPSAFEACFMSAAHTDEDIATALEKMRDAMRAAIA